MSNRRQRQRTGVVSGVQLSVVDACKLIQRLRGLSEKLYHERATLVEPGVGGTGVDDQQQGQQDHEAELKLVAELASLSSGFLGVANELLFRCEARSLARHTAAVEAAVPEETAKQLDAIPEPTKKAPFSKGAGAKRLRQSTLRPSDGSSTTPVKATAAAAAEADTASVGAGVGVGVVAPAVAFRPEVPAKNKKMVRRMSSSGLLESVTSTGGVADAASDPTFDGGADRAKRHSVRPALPPKPRALTIAAVPLQQEPRSASSSLSPIPSVTVTEKVHETDTLPFLETNENKSGGDTNANIAQVDDGHRQEGNTRQNSGVDPEQQPDTAPSTMVTTTTTTATSTTKATLIVEESVTTTTTSLTTTSAMETSSANVGTDFSASAPVSAADAASLRLCFGCAEPVTEDSAVYMDGTVGASASPATTPTTPIRHGRFVYHRQCCVCEDCLTPLAVNHYSGENKNATIAGSVVIHGAPYCSTCSPGVVDALKSKHMLTLTAAQAIAVSSTTTTTTVPSPSVRSSTAEKSLKTMGGTTAAIELPLWTSTAWVMARLGRRQLAGARQIMASVDEQLKLKHRQPGKEGADGKRLSVAVGVSAGPGQAAGSTTAEDDDWPDDGLIYSDLDSNVVPFVAPVGDSIVAAVSLAPEPTVQYKRVKRDMAAGAACKTVDQAIELTCDMLQDVGDGRRNTMNLSSELVDQITGQSAAASGNSPAAGVDHLYDKGHPLARAFHAWLSSLQSAVATASKKAAQKGADISEIHKPLLDVMIPAVKGYIQRLRDTLQLLFPKWSQTWTRRAAEEAVFQSVYPHLVIAYANRDEADNLAFERHLVQLKLLHPRHLQIPSQFWSLLTNQKVGAAASDPEPPPTPLIAECIRLLTDMSAQCTPMHKLQCLVAIGDAISKHAHERLGPKVVVAADELLPMLVFIICKSPCRLLRSELNFIDDFIPNAIQHGKLGYFFVTATMAAEYVQSLDLAKLDQEVAEAEAKEKAKKEAKAAAAATAAAAAGGGGTTTSGGAAVDSSPTTTSRSSVTSKSSEEPPKKFAPPPSSSSYSLPMAWLNALGADERKLAVAGVDMQLTLRQQQDFFSTFGQLDDQVASTTTAATDVNSLLWPEEVLLRTTANNKELSGGGGGRFGKQGPGTLWVTTHRVCYRKKQVRLELGLKEVADVLVDRDVEDSHNKQTTVVFKRVSRDGGVTSGGSYVFHDVPDAVQIQRAASVIRVCGTRTPRQRSFPARIIQTAVESTSSGKLVFGHHCVLRVSNGSFDVMPVPGSASPLPFKPARYALDQLRRWRSPRKRTLAVELGSSSHKGTSMLRFSCDLSDDVLQYLNFFTAQEARRRKATKTVAGPQKQPSSSALDSNTTNNNNNNNINNSRARSAGPASPTVAQRKVSAAGSAQRHHTRSGSMGSPSTAASASAATPIVVSSRPPDSSSSFSTPALASTSLSAVVPSHPPPVLEQQTSLTSCTGTAAQQEQQKTEKTPVIRMSDSAMVTQRTFDEVGHREDGAHRTDALTTAVQQHRALATSSVWTEALTGSLQATSELANTIRSQLHQVAELALQMPDYEKPSINNTVSTTTSVVAAAAGGGGSGGGSRKNTTDMVKKGPSSRKASKAAQEAADNATYMATLTQRSWYRSDLDRAGAVKILESMPPGGFILRPSSHAGALALTHASENHGIGHVLIRNIDNKGFARATPSGGILAYDRRIFPTIEELLFSLGFPHDCQCGWAGTGRRPPTSVVVSGEVDSGFQSPSHTAKEKDKDTTGEKPTVVSADTVPVTTTVEIDYSQQQLLHDRQQQQAPASPLSVASPPTVDLLSLDEPTVATSVASASSSSTTSTPEHGGPSASSTSLGPALVPEKVGSPPTSPLSAVDSLFFERTPAQRHSTPMEELDDALNQLRGVMSSPKRKSSMAATTAALAAVSAPSSLITSSSIDTLDEACNENEADDDDLLAELNRQEASLSERMVPSDSPVSPEAAVNSYVLADNYQANVLPLLTQQTQLLIDICKQLGPDRLKDTQTHATMQQAHQSLLKVVLATNYAFAGQVANPLEDSNCLARSNLEKQLSALESLLESS